MMRSAEDFERRVCDSLRVLLPAALDAIEAEYLAQDQGEGLADPDGTSWVRLDPPPAALNGQPGGLVPGGVDVRRVWPTVEVAVADAMYENFSLGQTDADGEIALIVCIWLKDARFPVLERASKRYSSAVFDCLRDPQLLGASIRTARFAWRTNPEARDANERIESGNLIVLTLDSTLTG
jgi:hypothetical protein